MSGESPWDNYLVVTGVWWCAPQIVTGATIGWAPIEECTFFVLQTMLTGLCRLWSARRLPVGQDVILSHNHLQRRMRLVSALVAGAAWLGMVIVLLTPTGQTMWRRRRIGQ